MACMRSLQSSQYLAPQHFHVLSVSAAGRSHSPPAELQPWRRTIQPHLQTVMLIILFILMIRGTGFRSFEDPGKGAWGGRIRQR